MATRSKPNWKLLNPLLTILEKEGWTLPMIASDWGMSLATLEGHLTQEVPMSARLKHDYEALVDEYDQRVAGGESPKEIRAIFNSRGIVWGTFQNQRTAINRVRHGTPEEHQDTPENSDHTEVHPGTLEGYQEVMEDVSQSVPDVPYLSTDAVQSADTSAAY